MFYNELVHLEYFQKSSNHSLEDSSNLQCSGQLHQKHQLDEASSAFKGSVILIPTFFHISSQANKPPALKPRGWFTSCPVPALG